MGRGTVFFRTVKTCQVVLFKFLKKESLIANDCAWSDVYSRIQKGCM